MASEVVSSINSEGYTQIRSEVMGKKLSLATGFLQLTEEEEQKDDMQHEALQNIEDGLNHVSDEVYDKIAVEKGEISTVNEQGEKTSWSIHEKIHGMVTFFKQRSATKKKVRDIANKNVQFSAEDFSVIARNFEITELEASHLIDLLKNCFSDNGRFRRNFFEMNIPHFLKYESKVFEFLWHYLKELSLRQDRVAFLNALQLLVVKLDEPKDALRTLLADIFNRSSTLSYSDRNGLMLGNILFRYYNREENSNIELSPEEVLLVRKGLNHEMVDVVLEFFEEHQELVMRKVRRINEVLNQSSAKAEYGEEDMQPRFLLYLMRELVIFLALTGGELSMMVVNGIVKEFGKPSSKFYKDMKNKKNLKYSLQFLQVAARALRRFNEPQFEAVFEEIASKAVLFVNLAEENPSYATYVTRVLDRIMQPAGT
jgi:hypothetical protein